MKSLCPCAEVLFIFSTGVDSIEASVLWAAIPGVKSLTTHWIVLVENRLLLSDFHLHFLVNFGAWRRSNGRIRY